MGQSDIYADPVLYPNPNLVDHIVCIVSFTMIVNPDIPSSVTSLTQQNIIDIFSTGKLRNWKDLGGPNLPIVPVVRADTSGTRASFLKYVLNGMSEYPLVHRTTASGTMLQTVANTPGAIGYVGLSYVDKSVRTLAINGQNATPQAIAAGMYAFWGYEHMYTMSDDRKPALEAFLQFMLTPVVQKQAQLMDYIPLAQVPLPTAVSGSQ